MRDRQGMMPLVVREIANETPSILSLRLEHPDAEPLPPWQPGAHVDVQLITRHERQYSLCGDPADDRGYRIAVHREELSRGGSHYIHTFLRAGSRVWVRPPRNHFPLEAAPSHLLLAAGIGITPLLSMARALEAAGTDWRLVYAVRTRADIAFASELDAFGDRVRIHVGEEEGRLDLAAVVAAAAPDAEVYACGPARFTDALRAPGDAAMGGRRLHLELFAPRPREHHPDQDFEVRLARSGRVVPVPVGTTMLHALQGADVEVGGSCLRGVCGSCALRVVGGTPEHRDSLTTSESSTTIYPCVSRALSPTLTVDA